MNLLPEEEILSNNEILGLTLTSHRLRSQTNFFNTSFMTSIMLENIASISVARFSYPWLIPTGVLSIVIGVSLLANNSNLGIIFVSIGFFLFLHILCRLEK